MRTQATSVDAYLSQLPSDRREALLKVRDVVRKNLPSGYEEGLQYGMIGYYIPLQDFPNTYNGQPLGVAAIASQKNHMAIYLMGLYSEPGAEQWFRDAWSQSGARKLDMGKSCVRFKNVNDLALDVIGAAIARVPPKTFIDLHNTVHGDKLPKHAASSKPGPARKKTAKKARKASAKPTAKPKVKKAAGSRGPARKTAKRR